MTKFSNNIFSLEQARKYEIIERTKIVKKALDDYYYFERRLYSQTSISYKLGKAISLYHKIYKERLTIEEETIVYLYIVFPSDKTFISLLKNSNIKQIADTYQVSVNFVKLRYKILKENLNYENNKTLKK